VTCSSQAGIHEVIPYGEFRPENLTHCLMATKFFARRKYETQTVIARRFSDGLY
jgi:hypothetical protein